MRLSWAYLFLCVEQVGGCANPQPLLTHVDPAQSDSESDVWLTLEGDRFVPSSTVDPVSGARSSTMDGFHVRVGAANVWPNSKTSPGSISAILRRSCRKRLRLDCLLVLLSTWS